MLKQKILLIFISVIVLFSVVISVVFYFTASELFKIKSSSSATPAVVKDNFPSERAETFSITGGKTNPLFVKEIIIDPAASPTLSVVKEGEKQTYSVWARDPKGIANVSARIRTDKKEEIIDFKLVEGPETEGRWLGYWITKDISISPYYTTVFEAANKEGKTAKLDFVWYVQK